MLWWHWMFAGLALLGAELVTPGGFYILFFGLSALVVGTAIGLGLAIPDWAQWLLFSVLAVFSLVLFRGRLRSVMKRGAPTADIDSLIGEQAVALEPITAGAIGKVELRGSAWNAKNSGAAELAKGQRCRVERVEGLTLWVTAG
jgi:membrane protein implicated in regulation of membrane protease activity